MIAFFLASDKDLTEGAYKGYIQGLGDQYSNYMTKEEYQEDLESYSGEYSGIGITFNENDNGEFEVYEVSEGSPAEEAGIVKGDLIIYDPAIFIVFYTICSNKCAS